MKALKTSPLRLDKRSIKIGKDWFTSVKGISKSDSEKIRQELVKSFVLNRKFELTVSIRAKISDPDFRLGLSNHYDQILLALMNDPDEDRIPSIYGKPFSYYYNIIEKPKIVE